MKHTSGNQVNIQIKLYVHPNIISKGTKTWIKRSLRVVTWLGYKRKDICGSIELKWPSIREHSLYSHSKEKFKRVPLILTNPWCLTWYTLILTTYSIFGFFFLFLFFFFFFFFFIMYTLFSSFLSIFVFTNNVVFDHK